MLQDIMVYDLELLAFSFGLLATLAMLVKHERKLKRWLLRSRRRPKKTAIRPVLW
jgi:hypothetical protein